MKNFFLRVFRSVMRTATFFVTFSMLLVLVLRWLPVSWTPLMFIRTVQQVASGEKVQLKHTWVPLDRISNHLQLAVVACEDQNFLHHHGFDFESIMKARQEAEDGDRVRGASTISQQTAKNVFLWPTSSWLRKGFETWFTVLTELFWSKQRIMEVYLNSIEFGNGIYGCEAASEVFFKKDAGRLSENECALLAVVLPDPLRYNAAHPSDYLLRRRIWALQQMSNLGGSLHYGEDNHPGNKSKK